MQTTNSSRSRKIFRSKLIGCKITISRLLFYKQTLRPWKRLTRMIGSSRRGKSWKMVKLCMLLYRQLKWHLKGKIYYRMFTLTTNFGQCKTYPHSQRRSISCWLRIIWKLIRSRVRRSWLISKLQMSCQISTWLSSSLSSATSIISNSELLTWPNIHPVVSERLLSQCTVTKRPTKM